MTWRERDEYDDEPLHDDDRDDPREEDMDPDDDDDDEPGAYCPDCGAGVYEFADQCPSCGNFIVPTSAPPKRSRTPHRVLLVVFLLTGAILIAAATVCR